MNIRKFFMNIHSEMRGAEYSVRYIRYRLYIVVGEQVFVKRVWFEYNYIRSRFEYNHIVRN